LAKRLGTSTYTLTYQFGSKDQLLADAVRHALALQVKGVNELVADEPGDLPSGLIRRLWEWSTRAENLGLVRVLLEATTLAYSQPLVFGGVGRQVVAEGRRLLTAKLEGLGLDPASAERLATRTYATLIGLQVDLIATGDGERVGGALEDLSRSVDGAVGRSPALATEPH
jgi:AcrR family transcriptional regulator